MFQVEGYLTRDKWVFCYASIVIIQGRRISGVAVRCTSYLINRGGISCNEKKKMLYKKLMSTSKKYGKIYGG
jgi:hypothetical protein